MKPPSSLLPLLLIVTWLSHSSATVTRCHDSEKKALLEFKRSLGDPSRRLSSWVVGDDDCCAWEGVGCSNATGHVTKLDLRNRRRLYLWDDCTDDELYYRSGDGYGCKWVLHGRISPSLLSLQHLHHLDLSGNFFGHSPVPEFLGSLKRLTYLNLSSAGFKGQVPHQLGNLSRLHILDLSYNYYMDSSDQFTRGLYVEDAAWISRLTSLRHLNMKRVNFQFAFNWLESLNALPLIENVLLADCHLAELPHSLPHINFTFLTALNLEYNSMNSSVPDWLFNMTNLKYLYLGGNKLSWSSSGSINKLVSLRELDLFGNKFVNNFKPELAFSNLCKLRTLFLIGVTIDNSLTALEATFSGCLAFSLEELDLVDTKLRGPLPDWLGNMKNLKFLGLSFNLLHGPLLSSLASMLSLQGLDLRHNNLSGTVAEEIGQMKGLVYFNLGYNSLRMSEVQLANLSSLRHLDISHNTLVLNESHRNWVPPFQLDILHMALCRVEPEPQFPNWLRTQQFLYDLDLTGVGIRGMIPRWLPSSLMYLHISNNDITGSVPRYLQNITFLDLSNNLLSGELPFEITKAMPNIYWLDLSMNQLSGNIPSSFCQINFWVVLRISQNNISGELPSCWKTSSHLVILDLSSNKLQGDIPDSLCNFQRLQSLQLSHNSLSGEVPTCFVNLKRMVTLNLAYNYFSGSVSAWLGENLLFLRTLKLRSNSFTGNVPNMSHLQYLQILDLSNNNLSGSIPPSFGDLSAMKYSISKKYYFSFGGQENIWLFVKGNELEYNSLLSYVRVIDLSNNCLSGIIPDELSSLQMLQSLNLSENFLTGNIPTHLDGMQQLEVLDLSRNNLSGTIPSSLGALHFLNHLNLSFNNLSGKIPAGNQLQTFVDLSIYAGNPNLCGPPLSKSCGDDTPRSVGQGDQNEDGGSSTTGIIWLCASIALGFVVGFWAFFATLVLQRRWRVAYFQAIDDVYLHYA